MQGLYFVYCLFNNENVLLYYSNAIYNLKMYEMSPCE
jgi:hypothetical protein